MLPFSAHLKFPCVLRPPPPPPSLSHPRPVGTEDTGLDADGFHVISNRGKFAEKLNPLQQKLADEKRRCVKMEGGLGH